jgi:hypothetical protein
VLSLMSSWKQLDISMMYWLRKTLEILWSRIKRD